MLPIGEVTMKSVYKIPDQYRIRESPGFGAKPNCKSCLRLDSSELLWAPFLLSWKGTVMPAFPGVVRIQWGMR